MLHIDPQSDKIWSTLPEREDLMRTGLQSILKSETRPKIADLRETQSYWEMTPWVGVVPVRSTVMYFLLWSTRA